MQQMKMVVPAVMVHRPENKKRRKTTTGKTKVLRNETRLPISKMLATVTQSIRSKVLVSHPIVEIDART